MDTYQQIINLFSNLPVLDNWNEIHSLFERVASEKPYHWSLPILACEAVGGNADQAIPTALAVACSHVSIILVDDMLDSDPRGEYRLIGMPATANIACAFQSAALSAISFCEFDEDAKMLVLNRMNEMILATALGQYLDTQPPVDEEMYWRIVKTKSSPFFGASLQIGGLAGGSSVLTAEQLKELGCLYGEMIQIHDDINDVLAIPANPDWTEGRSALPIMFAQLVEHPNRARFFELCKNITDEDVLEEAQNILIQSGAVSYCVDQLIWRYQRARHILGNMSLARREVLDDLIEKVIAPVRKLFESIGELPPTGMPYPE